MARADSPSAEQAQSGRKREGRICLAEGTALQGPRWAFLRSLSFSPPHWSEFWHKCYSEQIFWEQIRCGKVSVSYTFTHLSGNARSLTGLWKRVYVQTDSGGTRDTAAEALSVPSTSKSTPASRPGVSLRHAGVLPWRPVGAHTWERLTSGRRWMS